jgi:amidohydrolase
MLRRLAALALLAPTLAAAQRADTAQFRLEVEKRTAQVLPKVVGWRRDIHQHPELSYQEVRTAALVAAHLRALGLEVREKVGGTGVVAVLKGGKPGPVVALRADMDALPVTEQVDVPFKSTVRTTYNGQDVGVMHACGHDMHTAMLMGAAEVLAGMKAKLPGTVLFLFQPAEEAAPDGGAKGMIADGAVSNPKPDAVFMLHTTVRPVGALYYTPGPSLAGADNWRIVVRGKQTGGSNPWGGKDPLVVGAQIVLALQTIVSRQVDLTTAPAVLSLGAFNGGVRENIIPDSAVMIGTLRTFNEEMRRDIHARMKQTAEGIAASAGLKADVTVTVGYPITVSDPALVARMTPALERAAGPGNAQQIPWIMAGEDFSRFATAVNAPAMFVSFGTTPRDKDWKQAGPNHSTIFNPSEESLPIGVRAYALLATDFLAAGVTRAPAP